MTEDCRPGKRKTYLTIGQDLFSIQEYVTSQFNYSLHHSSIAKRTNFVPAAAMAYTDLASLKGLVRPADYGSGVEYASGIVNSIFPNTEIGLQLGLWLNGTYGCQQIINGEMDQQMNKLRKYLTFTNASAVFLRIGYEFDNPFFGYSDNATAYILAFQSIVDYMRNHLNEDRLDRTFFVWHSWAAPRAGNLTLEDFYPSNDYVDWIGVSVFRQVYPWKSNWGNGYVDWGGTVENIEEVLQFAKKRDKPTMIAESTPFGGINMKTADTIKFNETDPWDRWFGKVLNLIENYDIDMFSYINCDWDKQKMWRGVGFGDTRLSSNTEVMDRWFSDIIRSSGKQRFLMGNSICRDEGEVAGPKSFTYAADMPFFIPVILLVIAIFIFGKVYRKIERKVKMEQIQSAEQLEQCILAATNPLSPSKDIALSMLNHMCNTQIDGGAQLCIQVLNLAFSKTNPANATQYNQENSVVFYALTTLQRALCKTKGNDCIVPYQYRDSLRQIIYHHIFKVHGQATNETEIMPKYMRTKVGVVVALLIKHDFIDRWQNAFQELIQLAACEVKAESILDITRKEIFLRVLNAFCDEVVEDTTTSEKNTLIKDVVRGMKTSISCEIMLENTISADIIKALISLFQCNIQRMFEPNGTLEARKLPIRSLSVLKRFISWVDLSLVANETVIGLLISSISHAGAGDAEDEDGDGSLPSLLISSISHAGAGDAEDEDGDGSLPSQCAAEAVECMKEIIGKGMEDDKKIELIYNVNLLERIMSTGVNLETVDGTHINVVIKIAELVNSIGCELLRHWTSLPLAAHDLNRLVPHLNILTEIFFKCFAYDDIDVSGTVVPLASQFILLLQKEMEGLIQNKQFLVSPHLPQMLSVMYNQMKYPSDFEFDYEDEDEAEEEVYRSELRKLNQTIIRASPEIALQFLCTALSQIPTPLSSSITNEIEAALRLIYHYCEGIRPPPGTKVVLKDPTFCKVLIALHTSDITSHPHREVLILYYDIAVRYADLLKEKPELLPTILGSISGINGLQHSHPRVRSRCCYLLLKLVKSLGPTLRQFVETAIIGINGLISHQALSLHPDDSLYLFETIGLLLGQTDIEEDDQRKYLIDIMTPHMKLIESLLQSPELEQDPEAAGQKLSYSIASIAFLSKGFGRNISTGAQSVLKETVQPCLNILQVMTTSDIVRKKILIYLQRMVLCVGSDMLQVLQPFLEILIANCFQDDILDVAQLMNQLCIKFKADAIPIIDVCILPLLHKATELLPDTSGKAQADIPPHILTEILHLKKIMLVSLYTITNSECAAVLISPRNITSLEHILKMAREGALVPEPVVKKTSVQIFVCLIEHWLATANPNIDASITTGFRSYLMDQFLPTMIQVFLSKNFNEKNLNEFRIVREVANIFFILQTKCDFGLAQYLANIVSSQTQQAIDPAIYNVFHNPTTKKDTEKAMKFFMLQVKPKLV